MLINAKDILEKLNPHNKINYDSVLKEVIADWQSAAVRPKLLIHSCCAPCSTYVLEYLAQYADITIYFANSNIHPRVEYEYRSVVQQKFIADFNEKTGNNVQFLEAPYQPAELGFDYFASALTLSPKKNSQKINQLGFEIQEIFSVNYLPSDFKKNNGYKRSIELCKEYDVYRQCYCGCIFAAKAQGVDLKNVIAIAKQGLEKQA